MEKQKLAKLNEAVAFFRGAAKFMEENPVEGSEIQTMTFKALVEFLEDTLRVAEERNKTIGWYMFGLTPEILLAMDIFPFNTEMLVLLLPTIRPDALKEFIDIGEHAGIPPEVCMIDKSMVGLMTRDELPHPDFVLGSSSPCDSIVVAYQIYQKFLPAPFFILDAPYFGDERDIDYYTNQMKEAIKFIEEQTGKKMDYDRLKEIVEEDNRAFEYLLEANELRKAVPCPQSGRLLFLTNFLRKFLAGSPKATAIFKKVRDDAKEKVEKGMGAVPEEANRVVWFHIPTFFDLSILEWMENEFKAVIAMDMISYLPIEPIDTSTPDSIIRGLAIKSLNTPMLRQFRGPIEFYTDDLTQVCEDYKADSVIFAGHLGCKHAWGFSGLVRETCKDLGIPILIFDLDCFDPTVTPSSIIKEKMAEFFKTLVA
jgi:benzoyl-CoA reductase/2-hydroxyglutaryl-CoA dehydratase subunit BcrC/BadD/HgdB